MAVILDYQEGGITQKAEKNQRKEVNTMTNEVCNLSFVNKKNSQRSERKRTQKKVDEALQTIVENMRILEGEESLDVKVKVTGYL